MSERPTILCVDDQATNLRVRAMLLEQFGCATLTAPDHQSTLRTVTENAVDLVVIDYHLADAKTGEEIARDLRVMCPRLPLIMLTGDTKLPESACQTVDAVLIKGSGRATELLDLIQKLLPEAEILARRPMLVKEPPVDNSEKADKAS